MTDGLFVESELFRREEGKGRSFHPVSSRIGANTQSC